MAIKIILIVLLIGLLVYVTRRPGSIYIRAWGKILSLVFVLFSVFAVLYPNALTRIAHSVGVGRGADLLLYLLVIAFFFTTVSTYLKLIDMNQRIVKLSREIALLTPQKPKK